MDTASIDPEKSYLYPRVRQALKTCTKDLMDCRGRGLMVQDLRHACNRQSAIAPSFIRQSQRITLRIHVHAASLAGAA